MALPNLRRHNSVGHACHVCSGPAHHFVPGPSAVRNFVQHVASYTLASCERDRASCYRAHSKDWLICWSGGDEGTVGLVSTPAHRHRCQVSNLETNTDLEKTMGSSPKRPGERR